MSDDRLASTGGNRRRNVAFRNEVVLALHAHGLESALGEGYGGDIAGLPWVIDVHNAQTMDLSGALTAVTRKATLTGCELFATVHRRKGHDVNESYVTMPLAVFTKAMLRSVD